MEYARKNNIQGEPVSDEIEYGLGSIYPMLSGLKENVYWFCGEDLFIRQIEGEKHVYHFLEQYLDRVKSGKNLPFMVDALNCSQGCIYGTGIEESRTKTEDTLYEIQSIKAAGKRNRASGAWGRRSSPKRRLRALNRQFRKLDPNDFVRKYTDKSKGREILRPDEKELNAIFSDMHKTTELSRRINCSSWGYASCRDMATAIYNGNNHHGNCIHYVKDAILIEQQKEREAALLVERKNQEISQKSESISRMVEEANEDFGRLNDSISEMVHGNNNNAQESGNLSIAMTNVVEFCDEMKLSFERIRELLKQLEANNISITQVGQQDQSAFLKCLH